MKDEMYEYYLRKLAVTSSQKLRVEEIARNVYNRSVAWEAMNNDGRFSHEHYEELIAEAVENNKDLDGETLRRFCWEYFNLAMD